MDTLHTNLTCVKICDSGCKRKVINGIHLYSSYQAQEEIRILEHLRKQDKDNTHNIIHLFDHFTFRNHTCITFELLRHGCQMAIAEFLESYMLGHSGFWTMAPLPYAAKFDPLLSLDCAHTPSTLAQSKERKG